MQKDRKLTPWLDTDLAPIAGEEWRDVVGYEGIYNVSNYGRVKSLKRPNSVGKTVPERVLRYRIHPKSRDSAVMLYADTVAKTLTVMVLVAEAFSIKKAANEVYIHKNKNLSDNRVHNIIVGSRSESCLLDRQVGGWLTSTKPVGTGSKNRAADHLAAFGIFKDGELVAKRCKTCLIELPLTQYQRTGGILVHTCKTCAASAAGVKEIGKGAYYKALSNAGLRKCSRCDAVKPLEEFGKDKNAALGRKRRCKACTRKAPEPTRPRPARRSHRRLAAGVPGQVAGAPSLGDAPPRLADEAL